MESAIRTTGGMRVRQIKAAATAQRVAPSPRGSWTKRLVKSIADFFRRRRFSRNRAKLRTPQQSGGGKRDGS